MARKEPDARPRPPEVKVIAWPHSTDLRPHLVEHHGMAPEVLDAHDRSEWVRWHAAEHAMRTPSTSAAGLEKGRHSGHLMHIHTGEARDR